MSTPTINRTNVNVTDDDGSNTTGTIWNAAWVTNLCDAIDAMFAVSYKQKSATYTALNTDDVIECTSGSFTVTLHAASDATRGHSPLTIKNSGSGTITVSAADNIDGSATITLLQYYSLTLMSNGSTWMIL